MVLLAYVKEWNELSPYLPELLRVLLIGKLKLPEGAGGIYEVARIDAHLVACRCGFESGVGIEMDVGHEGHVASGFL